MSSWQWQALSLSYSCMISHVLHAFVNAVEAAGSGGSVASKPSSWANLSLGLFYGALCEFVPDRLAQWNDLILKDTPSDFKLKPRAPALCLVCSHCLSGVVRSVILVVFFGRTGLECKYVCVSWWHEACYSEVTLSARHYPVPSKTE